MRKFFRWFRFPNTPMLDRARLAVQVFREGLPKVDRETDKAVSDRETDKAVSDRETDKAVADIISGLRKPGFPCPRCGTAITVRIPELLANSCVRCSQCGLELKMKWQEDANARRALENLEIAVVEVARARKFTG